MKKIFSLVIIVSSLTSIQAQDVTDALRYAQTNTIGTARFRAMSGAFGALGGDLSAISINPASSSIFANNQISGTISISNNKNNSNYFGSNASDSDNSFDLNQLGGVFVFENRNSESDWNKFGLSVNYENQNNFDNSIYFSGNNPTNSIDKYFLFYANENEFWSGIPQGTLQDNYFEDLTYEDQQAYLGYWGYIINPDPNDTSDPTISTYTSDIIGGGAFLQRNRTETSGYNGKLTFNASAQYAKKLTLGLSLNSHFSDFRKFSSFFESNNNNTTTTPHVKKVYFDNELHTTGSGFSFQLGAILKVTNEFRLGLAYESPTWYEFTDELSQSLETVSGSTDGELSPDVINPGVIMVYEPYNLKTPGKLTLSGALVLSNSGLLSIDYSFKDYGSSEFRPRNDVYYSFVNTKISNQLTRANELRIGGEHKIKQWSLRAGYRFEESPYKDKDIMGDLKGYSAGIGYNFGGTKLDFAYATAKRTYGEQSFSAGLTDRAVIKNQLDTFLVTLSFEL